MNTTPTNSTSARRIAFGLAIAVLTGLTTPVQATELPAGFTEALIADGLTSPTAIEMAPDGRLFILEQGGEVRVVADGILQPDPYLTLAVDSGGERGLMGIAFDPDFASSHFFYLYYTAVSPVSHNRVSRFVADEEAPPTTESEVIILELPDLGSAIWHMGGGLAFGADGKLYVGVGDHQNNALPQTLNTGSSTFGKILRINKDGSIPGDNPFYNSTSDINRAIWAYGLRNPYTMSFQPGMDRLFINEVGQAAWEEINLGQAGANFGWPIKEGESTDPAFTSPFHAYPHTDGNCSITGGAFYNPNTIAFPAMYVGQYFFMDYCSGWIKTIDPDSAAVAPFATGAISPVALTTGHDGNLYYLSRQEPAKAFRISANNSPAFTAHPTAQIATIGTTATFSASASGAPSLTYQWSKNGSPIPDANATTYTTPATNIGDDNTNYTVTVTNSFGSTTSNTAILTVTANNAPTCTILTPSQGTQFAAGDTIIFSGSATDNEDGTLPANSLTWRVDFHHGIHIHPFVSPFGDTASSAFTIETHGHSSVDVWYRIHLTATDSEGLTATTYRDIHPQVSQLTILSDPTGMEILVDGQTRTTPHVVSVVAENTNHLEAPSSQQANTLEYEFQTWSDADTRSHDVTVPPEGTIVTATYQTPDAIVYLSDIDWSGEPINRVGPVERDSSVGGSAEGDGNPIELNGIIYTKGLGAHSHSEITYDLTTGLDGNTFTRFLTDIGIDEDATFGGTVVFEVWLDGVRTYQSTILRRDSPTVRLDLDIAGHRELKLITTNSGDGYDQDFADWADSRFFANQLIAPPSELAASSVYSSVYLHWTDSSDNEEGFEIERAGTGGAFTLIHTTAAGATEYQDSVPTTSSMNDYRIRAINPDSFSTTCEPTTVNTSPPPTDLIAIYRIDGVNPDILHDSSGNGHHASVAAAVRSAGHSGSGLTFNGTGGSASTATPILNNLTSFTLAGWVKPSATDDLVGLFGQRGVASVGFATPGTLRLATTNAGTIDAAYPFPNNEWHHIIAVGDSTGLYLYLDGTLAQSGGNPSGYGASAESFMIGGDSILTASDTPFTGTIDDVRVYSRALNANEARNLSMTFTSWSQTHFTAAELANPTISAPFANPDFDSWPNLIEYGLRIDPQIPDPSNVVVAANEEGHPTLAFTRIQDSADLTYQVEVSSDLVAWQSGTDHIEITGVVDNGDGTDRVTVRDKTAPNTNPARFIRLKVSQLPTVY